MLNVNNTTNGVYPFFSFVVVVVVAVVPVSAVFSSIMITLSLFWFGSFRIRFGLLFCFDFVSTYCSLKSLFFIFSEFTFHV